MRFKICMVGCGWFARQCHGPALRRYAAAHKDARLAACCDADIGRALEFQGAFGFERHYSGIQAMLAAEEPDAVILAVPPEAACHAAGLVLGRGLPLLLEKPPGMSPAELGSLIAEAGRSGARVQVGFNRRYMPVMRRARSILDSEFQPGSPGRIDYTLLRFDRWDPDFSTTAIHALDAALFLAGSPFRAAEVRHQPQKQGDREATGVVVEAECVSGTRVAVNIQPVAGLNAEFAIIHAVGQTLEVSIPISPQAASGGSLKFWRGDKLAASYSGGEGDALDWLGVCGETEAFLGAVRSGAVMVPGLQDCRQQVALMEAMRIRKSGLISFSP
jgi:predicted dehydrogenase